VSRNGPLPIRDEAWLTMPGVALVKRKPGDERSVGKVRPSMGVGTGGSWRLVVAWCRRGTVFGGVGLGRCCYFESSKADWHWLGVERSYTCDIATILLTEK